LLVRRWVVEHFFAWASHFRHLAKDGERLPDVIAGVHVLAFVSLMAHRLVTSVAQSPKQALFISTRPAGEIVRGIVQEAETLLRERPAMLLG
jgi:hypothetical protein